MQLKIHVNDLLNYHVVDWRKIPLNQVEGKLFPYGSLNNRHLITPFFFFSELNYICKMERPKINYMKAPSMSLANVLFFLKGDWSL